MNSLQHRKKFEEHYIAPSLVVDILLNEKSIQLYV